jgi:hypothetical protein
MRVESREVGFWLVAKKKRRVCQFLKKEEVKMRRLSLIVFFVCLMTSSALATNTWKAATGYWNVNQYPNGLAPGTVLPDANTWSASKVPGDTEEVKINAADTKCTLDGDAGSLGEAGNYKLDLCGTSALTTELDIVEHGKIRIGVELKVGDAGAGGAGPYGKLVQTGGDVILNTATKSGKLEIGYKTTGVGYYTISGGTISGTGSMWVGCYGSATGGGTTATGSVGTFTVVGTSPSISVTNLFVGVSDPNAVYYGTGNVKFELDGDVSPITTTGNVYIDPCNTAVANLVVSLMDEDAPPEVIVLVKNGGANAVYGDFDSVTLNGLPGYYLVYDYNAEAHTFGNGNDIALIPEPATIALLGLGSLIAIRRKRK